MRFVYLGQGRESPSACTLWQSRRPWGNVGEHWPPGHTRMEHLLEALMGGGDWGRMRQPVPTSEPASQCTYLCLSLCTTACHPKPLACRRLSVLTWKWNQEIRFFVVTELHTQRCAHTMKGANAFVCPNMSAWEAGGWAWWVFVFRGTETII